MSRVTKCTHLEASPGDDDGDDNGDDDIYIMMKCLCVCHEKWALSPPELSAGGTKRYTC